LIKSASGESVDDGQPSVAFGHAAVRDSGYENRNALRDPERRDIDGRGLNRRRRMAALVKHARTCDGFMRADQLRALRSLATGGRFT
jgi:hypothetical protein